MERRIPQRARIADVAREAGVSKTAVSFAFNSPARLAPETARRIREVAASMGYRADPVARTLSQRRTHTVGVLTPQALSVVFSNPFFGEFAEGVGLGVEAAGYALTFISPLHGSLTGALARAMVDGAIVVGVSAEHPEVEQIRAAGIPLVMVDSSARTDQPGVEIDDEGGARAAAAHLLELGHRDLLVVSMGSAPPGAPADADWVTSRRLRGYAAALGEHGLRLDSRDVVTAPATIAGGTAALRRAWAAGRRPTGVLVMSDAMAIGVLVAARELGLRVPGDLSVVGYDDVDTSRHTDPPLTTVHQPIREKGERAVRLLLSLVDGRTPRQPGQVRLATRLIVRSSTAPVPDTARTGTFLPG